MQKRATGFANKHSDAIDTWTGAGCVGHRPEPEFGKHAELETKLHHALFAADNARTAENSLDIREAAARKELAKITSRLRDAAIKQVQFQIVEQADAIAELQAKLAELQASQHGAYEFVKSCDEKLYADFEVRHPGATASRAWRTIHSTILRRPIRPASGNGATGLMRWLRGTDQMDTVTGLLGAPMVPPLPGQVRAYYGNASVCYAYNMYATDYAAAKQNPDGALWSSAPQSTTKVYNRTYGGGQAPVGIFGGRFFPTGSPADTVGTYSNLANGTLLDM
jgi:hypothetical protein